MSIHVFTLQRHLKCVSARNGVASSRTSSDVRIIAALCVMMRTNDARVRASSARAYAHARVRACARVAAESLVNLYHSEEGEVGSCARVRARARARTRAYARVRACVRMRAYARTRAHARTNDVCNDAYGANRAMMRINDVRNEATPLRAETHFKCR